MPAKPLIKPEDRESLDSICGRPADNLIIGDEVEIAAMAYRARSGGFAQGAAVGRYAGLAITAAMFGLSKIVTGGADSFVVLLVSLGVIWVVNYVAPEIWPQASMEDIEVVPLDHFLAVIGHEWYGDKAPEGYVSVGRPPF